MKNQSDEEILSNKVELSEFRTRQITNLKHYKKATRKLNQVIKVVAFLIKEYETILNSKERLPRPVEMYLGFSWYISQDEIWRFFIDKTISEFSNITDNEVLKMLEDNYTQLKVTLKQCNHEKNAIKEEIEYLDPLLGYTNSGKMTENFQVEVKIDSEKLKMLKKKHRIKFFNDFSSWKADKLIEVDIPNQINQELDRLFNDRTFLFKEYETYVPDILEEKRDMLFDKINTNIKDYTLKEYGDISLQDVKELIQIQLSVLLKSYIKYSQVDNNNNKSNEKSAGNEIEHRIVSEIEKKDDTKKKKWTGTKTEFARLVNEAYEKEPRKYHNLKIASYELFNQYEFEDERWNSNKCYTLVRKT